MVNAWSLAASILDGTFEEDYPLMNKSKKGWSEEDEIRELDDYYDFKVVGSGNTAHSCLLYTSPSPRDATLSRMPSSA